LRIAFANSARREAAKFVVALGRAVRENRPCANAGSHPGRILRRAAGHRGTRPGVDLPRLTPSPLLPDSLRVRDPGSLSAGSGEQRCSWRLLDAGKFGVDLRAASA